MSERKGGASSRERCAAIREKLYPRSTWATVRFEERVLEFASTERSLLDVGCGHDARWLRHTAPRFGSAYGLDPEVETARGPRLTLLTGSVYRIPLGDGAVDVVSMRNLIEHLERPVRALRECRRVLRTGGKLVILGPNLLFPPLAAASLLPHSTRLFIKWILKGRRKSNDFPAYYRASTRRALLQALAASGFARTEVQLLSEHPVYFTASPLLYRAWAAFDRSVLQKERFGFLRHYLMSVSTAC